MCAGWRQGVGVRRVGLLITPALWGAAAAFGGYSVWQIRRLKSAKAFVTKMDGLKMHSEALARIQGVFEKAMGHNIGAYSRALAANDLTSAKILRESLETQLQSGLRESFVELRRSANGDWAKLDHYDILEREMSAKMRQNLLAKVDTEIAARGEKVKVHLESLKGSIVRSTYGVLTENDFAIKDNLSVREREARQRAAERGRAARSAAGGIGAAVAGGVLSAILPGAILSDRSKATAWPMAMSEANKAKDYLYLRGDGSAVFQVAALRELFADRDKTKKIMSEVPQLCQAMNNTLKNLVANADRYRARVVECAGYPDKVTFQGQRLGGEDKFEIKVESDQIVLTNVNKKHQLTMRENPNGRWVWTNYESTDRNAFPVDVDVKRVHDLFVANPMFCQSPRDLGLKNQVRCQVGEDIHRANAWLPRILTQCGREKAASLQPSATGKGATTAQ